jgi:dihydroxynaphthoic acid synthetase
MNDLQQLEDVIYETAEDIAIVTINRPHRYNAFRGRTIDELIYAFRAAWADRSVRCVILTGAGDKAFCAGGDVKQRAETGDYGPTASGIFEVDYFHRLLRDIPKPVIAAVNGAAIGGGHVFHVLCDLSIASETARFGQAGPRVGSFDAGFGTTYLARVIGEKRAREMWYLCREYDAATAERWGLVNRVVPPGELMDEARRWAADIAAMSPTAIKFVKHSFNTDTEHQAGLANVATAALELYASSPEGAEGARAFTEKRPPDFARYVTGAREHNDLYPAVTTQPNHLPAADAIPR